jgi:hypothetical protein
MPLRIPTGYAVCYNKFCDVDPVSRQDGNGFLDNWEFFTEDILQIVKMQLENGKWVVPTERKATIDLGWYPDSSINGQYKLVLVNENWEVIREKYAKNRFEVRDTIEEWIG